MSGIPRVFLDTSVKKHSIRTRSILRPIPGTGVYQFSEEDPTANVTGTLRREIDLLSDVAELARTGRIKLLSNIEATAELLSILTIPSPGESVLLGIEIESVNAPFEYSRLAGPMPPFMMGSAKDIQVAFFDEITDPRFLEIRRACGAYQGKGVDIRPNQIIDAFHVWTAEVGGAPRFGTSRQRCGDEGWGFSARSRGLCLDRFGLNAVLRASRFAK